MVGSHLLVDRGGDVRVLSLGAGVQSTTLFLMSLAGEVEPFDLAIFADTQAEPAEVYAHLAKLVDHGERHGLLVETVTAGSLTERLLDPTRRDGIQVPAFIVRDGEKAGMLRRQCTERFKSRPFYKRVNAIRGREHVTVALGISWDEVQRMRDPQRKWVTNEYPLIDKRMTRAQCETWLSQAGWSAPRSACTYCPYHDDSEWRRMKREQPADFAEAVRVDIAMRDVHAARIAAQTTSLTGTPYVHRALIPLADVDLRNEEDRGQGTLWAAECEGVCGI